jgi:hypothetical protein
MVQDNLQSQIEMQVAGVLQVMQDNGGDESLK